MTLRSGRVATCEPLRKLILQLLFGHQTGELGNDLTFIEKNQSWQIGSVELFGKDCFVIGVNVDKPDLIRIVLCHPLQHGAKRRQGPHQLA